MPHPSCSVYVLWLFSKKYDYDVSTISPTLVPESILIAEALELWSFRWYDSWVMYKNLNICDRYFTFPEFLKIKTSWVLFNHLQRRSAMAEGAGAGLMQQSGQDLASWEYFSYVYCPRGRKSWLRGTYQAHCVNEDILLDANMFEGGQHRWHNGKT